MHRRSFLAALGLAPVAAAATLQAASAEPANITMAAEWEAVIGEVGILPLRPMASYPLLDLYATETLEDELQRRIVGAEGRFTMQEFSTSDIRSELNWRGILID